jgi:alpha-L-fucosidase
MFGDWYAKHIYCEGSPQYNHHWRVYGHPSKSGYKDIIPQWKAENFDPKGLMRLFVDAGSKYFVAQAMHHDNFDNFDSAHQKWNSVNYGPKKDICKLWKEAASEYVLPFGLTEHLGASYTWWKENKRSDKLGPYAGVPYDGADPTNCSLYHSGNAFSDEAPWLTDDEAFQRHWFARIKDLIDKFKPDLLYSDSGLPFGKYGEAIVAHLYNTSASIHGTNQAVYNQKDTNPDIYQVGVLDIERGQRENIADEPWQTDTSVGDWFYNVKDVYKTPSQVLETLVDIISKNGNLVLNIPQRPDGTLDDECTYILTQMAKWMKGGQAEGIFGSRPYLLSGEGSAAFRQAHTFDESAVAWTSSDFRFSTKGETVYAYQMAGSPDGTGVVRSLASGKVKRITAVRSLGHGPIEFVQTIAGLNFKLPSGGHDIGPTGIAVNFE